MVGSTSMSIQGTLTMFLRIKKNWKGATWYKPFKQIQNKQKYYHKMKWIEHILSLKDIITFKCFPSCCRQPGRQSQKVKGIQRQIKYFRFAIP